jgi:hypothetical protein
MELPAPPLLRQNVWQAHKHTGWAGEPERIEDWENKEQNAQEAAVKEIFNTQQGGVGSVS